MVAWLVLALSLLLVGVNARVRYNSQLGTPYYNIRFADMTGDGIHEFLLFRNQQVYVTTAEYAVHGLIYLRLPGAASRIIHGQFSGGPKEVMCAQERTLGRLDCYVTNPANDALWWWWYQGDFILDREVIIGDYNSDGRDDFFDSKQILCYTPSTGVFQVYTWNPSTYFFEVMANWAPGNLGSGSLINYQVRAGDYNGDGRTDLIFYNPTAGQVLVYIASYDTSLSKYTMWWYFTSTTGWGGSGWECLVANLNGDATEDAILHNTATGQFLAYNLAWDPNTQKPQVLNVDFGQIHQGPNARAYFGKFKNAPATEDSGKSNIRDDAMVFSNSWGMWIRSDARWDGTKQTYWWAYTQYPINLIIDQDGDGIRTEHELGGYDPNNDGISDGILPSFGASPFVKADFMAGPAGVTWNYGLSATSISLAVSTMSAKGINLHIFTGNQVAYQQNLGNPALDWVRDVDPIKNANFPAVRVPFFHYCLMANRYGGTTSTGQARGIPAQDFIVTLGGTGTTATQVGTFLHELGHNLGLHHGSMDDTNYKPNHISIMNYAYQLSGIVKDGVRQFLYSDITCSSLNENSLSESAGVQCVTGSSTYQALIRSANVWTVVNTAFDWDRDGGIDASPVAVDVNQDSVAGVLNGGVNEFNALVYNGGSIGSAPAKRSVDAEQHAPEKHKSEPASIYEPPMEELPNSPFTFSEDFSAYNLKPHHGPQFLDVPQRHPDIFKSASDANVVTPSHHADTAESRNESHKSGAVNSEAMPSDFMAPILQYSHEVDMENGAVNPDLQQL